MLTLRLSIAFEPTALLRKKVLSHFLPSDACGSTTSVGLNTGRPESLRIDTLGALNKLGEEYKVLLSDDLMHMNRYGGDQDIGSTKVAGVLHFQDAGYRVIACVDNESDNLKAVSHIDSPNEILLLDR